MGGARGLRRFRGERPPDRKVADPAPVAPLAIHFNIRPIAEDDFAKVIAIALALPEWYAPITVDHLRRDLPFQKALVAERPSGIIGFVTFFCHESQGQLGWMGVMPGFHRRGVGRQLLLRTFERLTTAAVPVIYLDTVGDSVDYEPYARTRAFYRAMGFQDYTRTPLDNPDCPELLTMVRSLP